MKTEVSSHVSLKSFFAYSNLLLSEQLVVFYAASPEQVMRNKESIQERISEVEIRSWFG